MNFFYNYTVTVSHFLFLYMHLKIWLLCLGSAFHCKLWKKYFFQENLSLKKNQLEKLFGELTELKCLRSLNVRHNKVKSSGIPAELFQLEELTTLDLSHNRLKEVPEGLEKAKSLLVLNLSNNK